MKIYQLRVRTRSPLVIAARHAAMGGSTTSLDYIPGSVVRGALADAWLRQGVDPQSAAFQSLFVRGRVRYGNLYPTNKAGLTAWPLPLTAWSCKYDDGFLPSRDKSLSDQRAFEGHGVRDSLHDNLRLQAALKRQTPPGELEEKYDCCPHNGCAGRLEAFSGYYVQGYAGGYARVWPRQRLITRTSIAGSRGVARDNFLYTLNAIAEEQMFTGFVHLHDQLNEQEDEQAGGRESVGDSLEQAWEAMFGQVREGVRMGLGRSRGLGELQRIECDSSLTAQHLGIKHTLQARWRQPDLDGLLGLAPERFVFTVTLYSDAILLDDYGRYQTALSAAAWRRLLRYRPPGAEAWPKDICCEWGASETRPVQTWRMAPGWGLRSAEELAISRGAVFVCSAKTAEADAVLRLLQYVEADGIGQRRSEGFGQIVVGHPWHWEGGDVR